MGKGDARLARDDRYGSSRGLTNREGESAPLHGGLSPDPWVRLRWRGAGQPELFGSGEQMLNGGGVPPRSSTRCTFAHGLKLGGDLLQGAVRRGGGDAGDQPDQPVIARLARC